MHIRAAYSIDWLQVRYGRPSTRCSGPFTPSPPAPAQAGQQAQQQQEEHPTPPAQQGWQIVHLNWSHFKPEFSGKPEEDAESPSALHQ